MPFDDLLDIASKVTNQFYLAGLVIIALLMIFRSIISMSVFSVLDKKATLHILDRLMLYVFMVTILTIILALLPDIIKLFRGISHDERNDKIILSDNFDKSDEGYLPKNLPNNTGKTYIGYVGGEYLMKIIDPRYAFTLWVYIPIITPDVQISIDAKILGETDGRYIILQCRGERSSENGYSLVIQPHISRYQLQKIYGNNEILVLASSRNGIIKSGNSSNKITMSCKGDKISVSINGYMLATVIDQTYRQGVIRIGTGARAPITGDSMDVDARFDNLIVTE